MNFPIKDRTKSLVRCVEEPGSWVLLSVPQSNKTAAAACIGLAAGLKEFPFVMIVKDLYSNVKTLEKKIDDLVQGRKRQFGSAPTVVFLAGGPRQWEIFSTPIHHREFNTGNILLVLPAAKTPIELLHKFLEEAKASNVVVVLDEVRY